MYTVPAKPNEVPLVEWDAMTEEERVMCSRFFALVDIIPEGEVPMLLSLSMH